MKHTLVALPALLLMAALPPRTYGSLSEGQILDLSGKRGIFFEASFSGHFSKSAHMDGKKADWVDLFDGKTTKGWHTYGKTAASPQWEVKDGALHLDKSKGGGGDLLTDKTFSNFDLKLEWKISPKGNSGILFYVHEDPSKYQEAYHTGPEMQVLDNDGHSDGKIHKHRAGDLYDLIPCIKETVRPVGEWNKVEIISNNGKLQLFLNGTNVVTTTLWDDSWKKMVADSKFKQWPDFGTFKSGKIDLQDHGNEVWYRNIKIKEL